MIGTLHIVLAMKPTQGNFAENALRHGVVGLNIEACRLKTGGCKRNATPHGQPYGDEKYWSGKYGIISSTPDMDRQSSGRFPSNVILSHAEGCVLKGMKKVKGHSGYPNGPGGLWSKEYQETNAHARNWNNASTKEDNKPWTGHADAEGNETVEDWECVESCPVKKLGEQSGESESTDNPRRCQPSESIGTFKTHYRETQGHNDTGTAARFFYTVKEFQLKEDEE